MYLFLIISIVTLSKSQKPYVFQLITVELWPLIIIEYFQNYPVLSHFGWKSEFHKCLVNMPMSKTTPLGDPLHPSQWLKS